MGKLFMNASNDAVATVAYLKIYEEDGTIH